MRRSAIVTGIVTLVCSQSFAYEPPMGLKWGMSYDQVKATLANASSDKPVKLGKLEEPKKQNSVFFYPDRASLNGLKLANVSNVKLLDRKIEDGWAVFHDSAGLILYEYEFLFISGSEEADNGNTRAHFQKLREALVEKYGNPSMDEISASETGKPIPLGVSYKSIWQDSSSGDEITLVISHKKHGSGVFTAVKYNIYLMYSTLAWDRLKAKPREGDL